MNSPPARRGRAAATNPPTRFDGRFVVEDFAALDEERRRRVETLYLKDTSRTILARNDSPDIPFTYSLNPYRGCEHGCIYCYARPSHEYLSFSAGLDFETRILVKERAPELLARAFRRPSWTPQVVSLSGNTDPYQPVERRLELTRRCLAVFLRHRNPVAIVTKNALVLRDLDLLRGLAALDLVRVMVSVTSLRDEITAAMEPRTARPARRLQVIERLAEAGVPVGVLVAPVVPGLTDEEMPAILEAVAARGATTAGYVVLRLPGPVKPLFLNWLERSFPDRAGRVVRRLESLRGETLTDNRYFDRMRGEGRWAELFRDLFHICLRRHGLDRPVSSLSIARFRRLPNGQMGLFEG